MIQVYVYLIHGTVHLDTIHGYSLDLIRDRGGRDEFLANAQLHLLSY